MYLRLAMLPPELWYTVLQYADPLQTRNVCRQWYHLSQSKLVETYRACRTKRLQVDVSCLQWICDTFQLTREEATANYNESFRDAARKGHLSVLQWLHATYQTTREEATTLDNWAFRRAAYEGHLPVLQWLHATYQITREEATTQNNYAFRCAADKGHLPVLQWLHATYQITSYRAEVASRHLQNNCTLIQVS